MKERAWKKRLLTLGVLAALAAIAAILANVPAVAEYAFSRGVTRWLSFLINRVTNFIPVSFYEILVLALLVACPVTVAAIIVYFCKRKPKKAFKCCYRVACAGLTVFLAFSLLYSPGYHREPLNAHLGIQEPAVTGENLLCAASFYVEKLNAASDCLERDASGNVISPLGFHELTDKLNQEYAKLDAGYFNQFTVRPKRVVASEAMSYLGITGIYFPFVAEANINMNSLDYEFPVLLAHEMAHAKGIARENEANFLAYYLCIRADDPYLNYSGLMDAAANLLNALSATDRTEYERLRSALRPEILTEWSNLFAHYRKYDTFLDGISSFFNNLFLVSNGVPGGIVSYSQTTRSLIGLYEKMR